MLVVNENELRDGKHEKKRQIKVKAYSLCLLTSSNNSPTWCLRVSFKHRIWNKHKIERKPSPESIVHTSLLFYLDQQTRSVLNCPKFASNIWNLSCISLIKKKSSAINLLTADSAVRKVALSSQEIGNLCVAEIRRVSDSLPAIFLNSLNDLFLTKYQLCFSWS